MPPLWNELHDIADRVMKLQQDFLRLCVEKSDLQAENECLRDQLEGALKVAHATDLPKREE